MALFSSGAKLLLTDSGSLASSSGCCCKTEDDPQRIVNCCLPASTDEGTFDGLCAQITAAECAFLGGRQVSDCNQCIPPPPTTSSSTNCLVCCDAQEIDALVSIFVSDPECAGIIGSGCNAVRRFGRLGESFVGQVQVTLQRTSNCVYSFLGCFPLDSQGNFTRVEIELFFSRINAAGQPGNVFGCAGGCRCVLQVSTLYVSVATCGYDNSLQVFCTQPNGGGSCQHLFSGPYLKPNYGQVFSDVCRASAAFTEQTSIRWSDLVFGCFTTIVPLLVTGSPKRRDIGNVQCQSTDFVLLDEETHTIQARMTVSLV
jgi:hypothetical protein